MNISRKSNPESKKTDGFNFAFAALFCGSVIVIAATFLITNSTLGFESKSLIFGAVVVSYLVFGLAVFLLQQRKINAETDENEPAGTESQISPTPEIEEKLRVFEEAQTFFSASLKPADMFRLVSSRIEELIPFSICAIFLANQDRTKLKIVQAAGESAAGYLDAEIEPAEGLAGKAFATGEVQAGERLEAERKLFANAEFDRIRSAAAAPLARADGTIFGVMALYNESEGSFDETAIRLLTEISARVAPLLANSLNYARNLENSLKDTLTNLPNERAFFLVLENQIAESLRLGEQRPLSVLSIDIKNFDELNKKYGHATGDKILSLTAKFIKSQLRQMDFLSRLSGDEFFAVLPTASAEVARMITQRIEKAFDSNPFQITENEQIKIQLNFGLAAFVADGETAQELMKRAVLKKQEKKSGSDGTVIFFPREYVN